MLIVTVALGTGSAQGGASSACQAFNVSQPIIPGKTPVLFVHGINSSYQTWASTQPPDGGTVTGTSESPLAYVVNSLGSGNAAGYTFNWSSASGETGPVGWVTDPPSPTLGERLAQAISCVAKAAGHQVIIIAHSMGGLITEKASTISPADIAAVFTLGTPYQGSWLATAAVGRGPDPTMNIIAQSLGVLCSTQLRGTSSPSPNPSVTSHYKPPGAIDKAAASACDLVKVNERNDPGVVAMRLMPGPQKLLRTVLPANILWYPLAASVQGVWQPVSPLSIKESLNYVGDGVVSTQSQLNGGSPSPQTTQTCTVVVGSTPRGRFAPPDAKQVSFFDAWGSPCFHTREPYSKTLLDDIISIIQAKHLIPTASVGSPTAVPEFYVHNGYELGSLYNYPNFPASIGLNNHDYISGLRWTQVNQNSGTAVGTLHYDNCTPSCAGGSYLTDPVELLTSAPQHCTVQVYKQNTDVSTAKAAYVFNAIYVKALSGNPLSFLVGYTSLLNPACGNIPGQTGSTPSTQPPPTQQSPAQFAIKSSSPTSGPAGGGTLIVIRGSGFSSVNKVAMNTVRPLPQGDPNYFKQNLHPSFSVVSDSEIVVTTPPGAAGLTYEIDFFTSCCDYFSTNFPGIPLFTFM
jgi:pimeloyl-ACP methyl ester carboxylesterase